MKKSILCVLIAAAMMIGCHHNQDPKMSNMERAKLLEQDAAKLQHEALCLKVMAGDWAALAEMKVRNTTCM